MQGIRRAQSGGLTSPPNSRFVVKGVRVEKDGTPLTFRGYGFRRDLALGRAKTLRAAGQRAERGQGRATEHQREVECLRVQDGSIARMGPARGGF